MARNKMQKGLAEYQEKVRSGEIIVVQRTPLEKLSDNPNSRKFAINAECYVCHSEGADSGWKWGIGNCQITACPLFAFRPYQYKLGKPKEGVYK